METIVHEAIATSEKEELQKKFVSTSSAEDLFSQPRIVVIGCGGAGNNTINRLHSIGIVGAETIAINTDVNHLNVVHADKKVLIGTLTKGLGAGGNPDVGEKSAELNREAIAQAIGKADLVFITAGIGGGTGTGASPVVAQIAKESGAIVVAMVSMPFAMERGRIKIAEMGLKKLREHAHTVIVLSNDGLLKFVPNQPVQQALSVMDQLIADTVKGVSESITQPSLINVDYADVKAIMEMGRMGTLLIGTGRGQDKARQAVKSALSNPLTEIDYKGGRGCLIHVLGGPDLTLDETQQIAKELTKEVDPNAMVTWGARIKKEFEGKVRVMAIVSGVESRLNLVQVNSQHTAILANGNLSSSQPVKEHHFAHRLRADIKSSKSDPYLESSKMIEQKPKTNLITHSEQIDQRYLRWIIGLLLLGLVALIGLFYTEWFK